MVYQPRIDREHVRRLYELKEATGVPMTVILAKILDEYFKSIDATFVRSADAIAHTACALLTLDRSVIGRLRESAPEKAAALSAVLCRLAARRIAETSERLVRWRMMAGGF
jgi:hypothetical protein